MQEESDKKITSEWHSLSRLLGSGISENLSYRDVVLPVLRKLLHYNAIGRWRPGTDPGSSVGDLRLPKDLPCTPLCLSFYCPRPGIDILGFVIIDEDGTKRSYKIENEKVIEGEITLPEDISQYDYFPFFADKT